MRMHAKAPSEHARPALQPTAFDIAVPPPWSSLLSQGRSLHDAFRTDTAKWYFGRREESSHERLVGRQPQDIQAPSGDALRAARRPQAPARGASPRRRCHDVVTTTPCDVSSCMSCPVRSGESNANSLTSACQGEAAGRFNSARSANPKVRRPSSVNSVTASGLHRKARNATRRPSRVTTVPGS